MRNKSRTGWAFISGLTAVLTLGGVVAPASAAVTGYTATVAHIGGGEYVNVRTQPSMAAPVHHRVAPGTPLDIRCQVMGSKLGWGPYAESRVWNVLVSGLAVHDVVTSTPGGPRVIVPASQGGGYVAWTTTIPRCDGTGGSARTANAVAWAHGQVDHVEGPTQTGRWSGWCETMVEQALGARAGTGYADAAANYRAQRAAGRINPPHVPAPAGAMVFYGGAAAGPHGHVALSIGDGQAIGTFGDDTQALPVREHAVDGRGLTYLGWAMPPDSWPGR